MAGAVEALVEQLLTIHFPKPQDTIRFLLVNLSSIGQSCDVTFRNRDPLIGVTVDKQLAATADEMAGRSGIGRWLKERQLSRQFADIRFSDGSRASLDEIWTVIPVPVDGIPADAFAAVDLSAGEQEMHGSGVTVREVVRELYRCKDRAREDVMLRRYLLLA
ncbi:MAG: hypothetical protein E6G97_24990 [Alphaproteobacteria bacterium]|nr:MAG: hypothetical protein E6G97_24990 [Alphaproteobacteria bacterium]